MVDRLRNVLYQLAEILRFYYFKFCDIRVKVEMCLLQYENKYKKKQRLDLLRGSAEYNVRRQLQSRTLEPQCLQKAHLP